MSEIENLFDEEYLVPNVKGAAFFILLYEHFEDVVISTVKEFYSSPCSLDRELNHYYRKGPLFNSKQRPLFAYKMI